MSVDIVAENALSSTYNLNDMFPGSMQGDISVAGFARQISVNVGEQIDFSVTGGSTSIQIFRVGYYSDAKGFRRVATIVNTPVNQPELVSIPNSAGATTATDWSVTASWPVPSTAVSGIYMAMIRNATNSDAFYATFIVRDDAATADIIYKTSDSTWGAAYNHYGTKANPDGKNVYGSGTGVGSITQRCFATSYHRPVITRGSVSQTYWWACELPLIRFLERNGYSVKYITSVDLDKQGVSILQKGKIFISSGHDEYWTAPMREAVETYRDGYAGRSIFMSGNEVFWKARYEHKSNGESIMWCYKDTMPGPDGFTRASGTPLDPVEWTGTWMDTRWPDHRDGALLTGTKFGMNGVYDYDAVIPQNPYGGHKVWGGSNLVDQPVTMLRALGFEADHIFPTQPEVSAKILAAYTRSAPGGLADANGELYNVPGNIEWGIVSQRYAGGGLTVGFGTCQWAWTLDGQHDRGIGELGINIDAQKFTVNLLRDMGADPGTLMSGITLQAKNSLDEYGLDPGGSSSTEEGWYNNAQEQIFPYTLIDGTLVPLFDVDEEPVPAGRYTAVYHAKY